MLDPKVEYISVEDWLNLSEDRKDVILMWLKSKKGVLPVLKIDSKDILYTRNIAEVVKSSSFIPVIDTSLILNYLYQEGNIEVKTAYFHGKPIVLLNDTGIHLNNADSLYKLFTIMLKIVDKNIININSSLKDKATNILFNKIKSETRSSLNTLASLLEFCSNVVDKEISCVRDSELLGNDLPLKVNMKSSYFYIRCDCCGEWYANSY